MAPTIIFDGDDTLWELQPLYDRAMDDFARLLSAELATSPEVIRDELLRIDASNVAQFGFGERRFSHSMSTLYERQCFVLGRPVLFDTKTKIANMAATVSTVFPKPMGGAREGEMLKVVSIDILTDTAIVRELTPLEEICYDESEVNVAPSTKSMEVRVQNGVMFKREEGNTYTPITLTDGKYLATFIQSAL